VWLKAPKGNQEFMIRDAPNRFFSPPYVGPSGWIGAWLDSGTHWEELAELVRDAYKLTAPKRLLAELDQSKRSTSKMPSNAATASAAKKAGKKKATKGRSERPKGVKAKHR
jgi:hypothetical protein